MVKQTNEDDIALLRELGIELDAEPAGQRTAREERIIAGFEEIERFVEEHGRKPQHGEDRDIFERLYAVRLDRLRESEECRALLAEFDSRGLLTPLDLALPADGDLDDEALLAALGIDLTAAENEITELNHVRSRREIKAAEEIAQRTPCPTRCTA